MKVRFSRNQWGFLMGWANDFDLIRMGLEWRDYETAKLCIVILGVKATICFRAYTWWETRRRIVTWWRPCPDCGMKFGKHNESVDHPPF